MLCRVRLPGEVVMIMAGRSAFSRIGQQNALGGGGKIFAGYYSWDLNAEGEAPTRMPALAVSA